MPKITEQIEAVLKEICGITEKELVGLWEHVKNVFSCEINIESHYTVEWGFRGLMGPDGAKFFLSPTRNGMLNMGVGVDMDGNWERRNAAFAALMDFMPISWASLCEELEMPCLVDKK